VLSAANTHNGRMNNNWFKKISQNKVRTLSLLVIVSILIFTTGKLLAPGTLKYVAALIPKASTDPSVEKEPVFHYIEIIDGCGPYYNTGTCVNMRSGPGMEYSVVGRLRTGVVLKVASTTIQNGHLWYKILFSTALLYPERVKGELYVAVDPTSVLPLLNIGDEVLTSTTTPTSKRIVVDISKEMLYAYDGDTLFMQEKISTGLDGTPTPRGDFKVFKKTPSRYMQGPIPGVSDQIYDLPGVPWDLYFTAQGAVIHGAYWHDHFGEQWSHGCVNLPPEKAKKIYLWADVGTAVHVQN
jgi:lipoprotein-anchoring transpeptidase ErfK/SrfK